MLVDIARLVEQFSMCSQSEPGKLDIRRREPGILLINLPIVSLFKLAIMTYFSIFCIDLSVISDVIQTVQRHHNLITAHAMK